MSNGNFKKSRETGGSDSAVTDRQPKDAGVGNTTVREACPIYDDVSGSEHVISHSNNSWIIMGRDRPGEADGVGYGALANTQCGAIDLCVGLGGPWPREYIQTIKKGKIGKNFFGDSARVYISQKADIDNYLDLPAGQVGRPVGKSAIGIKADGIRIVAREGIKLVTNTDNRTAEGAKKFSINGIDLIAGNNDADLQPMVKGDYLIDALMAMNHYTSTVNSTLILVIEKLIVLTAQLKDHQHGHGVGPSITFPSPVVQFQGLETMVELFQEGATNCVTNKLNLTNFTNNYLTPRGPNWILSRWNNVT